jgi:tight adherence protein C
MSAVFASLTVFLLFGAISLAIYAAIYGINRPFDERISEIGVKMRVTYGNPANLDLESDTFARSLFRWVAKRLPEPALNTPEREKLSQILVRAGFPGPRAVRIFHFVRLLSTALAAILALVAAIAFGFHGAKPVMFILMGLGVGAFAPSYYIGRKARNRKQEIASQLSDALDLLVVCVEAGLGLGEAIKVVGSETLRQHQEIGAELSIVSAELTAGSSLGQALRSFGQRTGVEDVKPLAATLVQSEKLGASIGPALRSISDSMRITRRLRAEEAAAKTTVKILFPLVLFILPAMMSVIVGPAMIQIMHALSR